jgi:hypothetical protein
MQTHQRTAFPTLRNVATLCLPILLLNACAVTPGMTAEAMVARGYPPAIAIGLRAVSFSETSKIMAYFTPQDRGAWWEVDYFAPWPKPDDGYPHLNFQQSRASQLLSGLQARCEQVGGSHDHRFDKAGLVHVRSAMLACRKDGRVIFFAKLGAGGTSYSPGIEITPYRLGVVELKSPAVVNSRQYPPGYREAIVAMGGVTYL